MQLEFNASDKHSDSNLDFFSEQTNNIDLFSKSMNEFSWSPKFLNISKNKFSFLKLFPRVQNKFSLKKFILGSLFAVLFLIFFFPVISTSIANNDLEEINTQIENKIAEYDVAIKNENKSIQRSAIFEALILIEESSLYDSNQKLAFLIKKVNKLKIEIDNIQAVTDSNKLLVFENKLSSQFEPTKIIVRAGIAWILDSASDRIFQYQIYNNKIDEIFRGGILINDTLLGKPESIMFDEYRKELLIFDSNSNFYTTGINKKIIQLEMPNLGNVSNIVDYSFSNGTFYFLNSSANVILYLQPLVNDYNNFNVEIKKLFNYEKNIFITGIEFNVKKIIFSLKQLWVLEDKLELVTCAGIDTALLSINDVVFDPKRNQIFISDPVNNRIVSCNYNGDYIQQWKSRDFFDIISISFDPNNLSLYVLTSNTVFEIVTM
jgi:hypothetical protein